MPIQQGNLADCHPMPHTALGACMPTHSPCHAPLMQHDKSADKGEGMSFLCCCFQRPKVVEAAKRDKGMDRIYSMKPSESMEQMVDKAN